MKKKADGNKNPKEHETKMNPGPKSSNTTARESSKIKQFNEVQGKGKEEIKHGKTRTHNPKNTYHWGTRDRTNSGRMSQRQRQAQTEARTEATRQIAFPAKIQCEC